MAAQAKYSEHEREAVTAALDSGLTGTRVAELAAAGELEHDGKPVPAFEITDSQARALARRVRAQRPPADRAARIEALQERALKNAEREMKAIEKAGVGKSDARRFRQLVETVGRLAEHERTIVASGPTAPQRSAPESAEGGALLIAMRESTERPIVPRPRLAPAPPNDGEKVA